MVRNIVRMKRKKKRGRENGYWEPLKMDTVTKSLFERIAKMEAMGVSNVDIAKATNLTDGRISQIQNRETEEGKEYGKILGKTNNEEIERFMRMNEGWDAIESQSLANLVQQMEYNCDAEFNLKVAQVANRATRRGIHGQRTIAVGQGNVRTTLTLNATFVDKLQQNFEVKNERGELQDAGNDVMLEQKDNDFLAPNIIEKMFKPKGQEVQTFDGLGKGIERKGLNIEEEVNILQGIGVSGMIPALE